MKTCAKCRVEQPLDDFYRNKKSRDGRQSYCKACQRAVDQRAYHSTPAAQQRRRERDSTPERRAANRAAAHRSLKRLTSRTAEQVVEDQRRLRPSGTKRCRACRETFTLDQFNSDRTMPDGLNHRCRPCHAIPQLMKAYLKSGRAEEIDVWDCAVANEDCDGPLGVDHIVARANGGTDDPSNYTLLCRTHNSSKNDTPVEEWLERLFTA